MQNSMSFAAYKLCFFIVSYYFTDTPRQSFNLLSKRLAFYFSSVKGPWYILRNWQGKLLYVFFVHNDIIGKPQIQYIVF